MFLHDSIFVFTYIFFSALTQTPSANFDNPRCPGSGLECAGKGRAAKAGVSKGDMSPMLIWFGFLPIQTVRNNSSGFESKSIAKALLTPKTIPTRRIWRVWKINVPMGWGVRKGGIRAYQGLDGYPHPSPPPTQKKLPRKSFGFFP